MLQMDQWVSALFLIEFLAYIVRFSFCFSAILHLIVVCVITFSFLVFLLWWLKTNVKPSSCLWGRFTYHTHGWPTLTICLIKNVGLAVSSVKRNGCLGQNMLNIVSDNIWSVCKPQTPFKMEITSKVTNLKI